MYVLSSMHDCLTTDVRVQGYKTRRQGTRTRRVFSASSLQAAASMLVNTVGPYLSILPKHTRGSYHYTPSSR